MSGNNNHFISPFSILMAFALLTEGAEGDSRKECIKIFGLDPVDILSSKTKKDIAKLTSGNGKATFNLANSIWTSLSAPLKDTFAKSVNQKYDAVLKTVNFSDPKTKGTINKWVGKKTNGMIPELIKVMPPNVILVIINAVYFKGLWDNKFNPIETKLYNFTISENKPVKCKFMFKNRKILHFADNNFQYGGFRYIKSPIILVTALPNKLVNPLTDLDLKVVAGLAKTGKESKFAVRMPKFSLDCNVDLLKVLQSCGLKAPFSNVSDFAKMVDGNACVSSVIHQAKIEVDEEGTKAAAATGMMMTRCMPRPNPKYYLDKPFSFFLVDTESEMILFSGVFRTPSQ